MSAANPPHAPPEAPITPATAVTIAAASVDGCTLPSTPDVYMTLPSREAEMISDVVIRTMPIKKAADERDLSS